MNITNNEITKKLHAKLDDGLDALKTTKHHLESFQNNAEAAVKVQLKTAKAALKEKKHGIEETKSKWEELIEAQKEETVEAVAGWKAKHEKEKLEKRAARAEEYADACVTLALYFAGEAELAILEAISARQDAITVK